MADHADDGGNNDVFIYMGGDQEVPEDVTHVRVHKSVKIITRHAFEHCHNLISIEMHDGVEIIEENAFFDCTYIKRITPRILNQQTYHAADGCLANSDKQTDICLASEHSSNVAVHCCRGSIENNNNLKCSRDGCKTRSTFTAAKNYCENKGMRLCSVAELETGACCDKGCGWNKKISWTSDSCETDNPPMNPKSSSSGTLVTFDGDRSADYESTVGVMFEVEAREDVSITSLSTLTGSSTKIWTEVWTREGSYTGKTASNDGWEMIYFKKSQQRGTAAPTE
jgi:hypothetical protein